MQRRGRTGYNNYGATLNNEKREMWECQWNQKRPSTWNLNEYTKIMIKSTNQGNESLKIKFSYPKKVHWHIYHQLRVHNHSTKDEHANPVETSTERRAITRLRVSEAATIHDGVNLRYEEGWTQTWWEEVVRRKSTSVAKHINTSTIWWHRIRSYQHE